MTQPQECDNIKGELEPLLMMNEYATRADCVLGQVPIREEEKQGTWQFFTLENLRTFSKLNHEKPAVLDSLRLPG